MTAPIPTPPTPAPGDGASDHTTPDEFSAYEYESMEDEVAETATAERSDAEPRDVHLAALRSKVSAKYGISPEDAAVLLLEEDEESMDAHARDLLRVLPGLSNKPDPSRGNVAPKEGSTRITFSDSSEELARERRRELLGDLFDD